MNPGTRTGMLSINETGLVGRQNLEFAVSVGNALPFKKIVIGNGVRTVYFDQNEWLKRCTTEPCTFRIIENGAVVILGRQDGLLKLEAVSYYFFVVRKA